jgi:hypothetical protein
VRTAGYEGSSKSYRDQQIDQRYFEPHHYDIAYVFLTILILFIVGGEVTKGFAFAMLIGVILVLILDFCGSSNSG